MLMLDVYICLCVGMRERARARASVFLDHGVAVELRIKVSRYTPRRQHNTHKVSQCKIHNLHEGVRRRCAEAAACQRVGPNTNLIIDNPYGCSRNIKFQQSKKPELGKIPNKPEATKSKKQEAKNWGKPVGHMTKQKRTNADPRATAGLVANLPPPRVHKVKQHTFVWVIDNRDIRVWIYPDGARPPPPRALICTCDIYDRPRNRLISTSIHICTYDLHVHYHTPSADSTAAASTGAYSLETLF